MAFPKPSKARQLVNDGEICVAFFSLRVALKVLSSLVKQRGPTKLIGEGAGFSGGVDLFKAHRLLQRRFIPNVRWKDSAGNQSNVVPWVEIKGPTKYMPQSIRFIVFSHLRWSFVFQRPQHILSRFAKDFQVVFIEEPVRSENDDVAWEVMHPIPNVTVARLHSPLTSMGFADDQLALLQEKLDELESLKPSQAEDHLDIVWMYSPLALPLLDNIKPHLVVFDSMDALDHFAHAPTVLKEREAALLKRADVVFTGGPSLQRRLEGRHANTHCFSSSVDAAHFGKAQHREFDKNPTLPLGPKLGYVGVIDERIDLELIAEVAAWRPEWQLVMVGPVVKIDPTSLPRAANIHYLGQQAYEDLPSFIAGWDVCIQPFAHNDSTKYISPTKTLEFFAAKKPVVSTSITDVAQPYGHIVFLADTPSSFVAQVERALDSARNEWPTRVAAMEQVLQNTSWDKTTGGMLDLIEIALNKGQEIEASKNADNWGAVNSGEGEVNRFHIQWDSANSSSSSLNDEKGRLSFKEARSEDAINDADVVVIGAGPTGLSATYHLQERALLLEKNDNIGGWCRSLFEGGFTFDFAGHIMFSNDPYVHDMYKLLLGDNCHWQDREAWIYSHGVHTRYPFQGALHGLPPDVIRECIMGAIEARFGSADGKKVEEPPKAIPETTVPRGSLLDSSTSTRVQNRPTTTGNASVHLQFNEKQCGDVKDCCADGVMESTAPLKQIQSVLGPRLNGNGQPANGNGKPHAETNGNAKSPANFEEFIYQVWGRGIAKHFAIPYNRKLWAVPLAEMETSWLGGRVPQPNLEEMIDGALQPVAKPQGPNARFGYPLHGGFQALMNGFLPHISDQLHLDTRIAKVSIRDRIVTADDGRQFPFEVLVNTMPLPLLIKALGDEAPSEIQELATKLRYVSVRCVNLGVGREKLTEKHWLYYPGPTVFHRIFVQGNASPHCNPQGGFGLTCEITYSPHKPLPCDGDALVERCIQDCIEVGMMRSEDPVWVANQIDMPFAYVVYDHARPQIVAKIRSWLKQHRILLAGRYSEWEYYNSDHAFVAGRRIADEARELLQQNLQYSSLYK